MNSTLFEPVVIAGRGIVINPFAKTCDELRHTDSGETISAPGSIYFPDNKLPRGSVLFKPILRIGNDFKTGTNFYTESGNTTEHFSKKEKMTSGNTIECYKNKMNIGNTIENFSKHTNMKFGNHIEQFNTIVPEPNKYEVFIDLEDEKNVKIGCDINKGYHLL